MATVHYSIISGLPPFVVSLQFSGIANNIHNNVGTYQFSNVSDGGYTLVVTDANGCISKTLVGVSFEVITTTTTTTLPPTTTTTTLAPTTTTTTTTVAPEVIVYGNMYNWWAASHPLIAPPGWRVTSNADWNGLGVAYGGSIILGATSEKVSSPTKGLKGSGNITDLTGLWKKSPDPSMEGNNSTGFNINPAGTISPSGVSGDRSWYANYWSTNQVNSTMGMYKQFGYNNLYMYRALAAYDKRYGFSIRILKNDIVGYPNIGDTGTVTDYDGNVYNTKRMLDGKVWAVENYRGQHYNDGTLIPHVTDPAQWAALNTGAINLYV